MASYTIFINDREYVDSHPSLARARCPECYEFIPLHDDNWECGEILQLYNRQGVACVHCTKLITEDGSAEVL